MQLWHPPGYGLGEGIWAHEDEVVSKVFNMSKKSDIMGDRGGVPLN